MLGELLGGFNMLGLGAEVDYRLYAVLSCQGPPLCGLGKIGLARAEELAWSDDAGQRVSLGGLLGRVENNILLDRPLTVAPRSRKLRMVL